MDFKLEEKDELKSIQSKKSNSCLKIKTNSWIIIKSNSWIKIKTNSWLKIKTNSWHILVPPQILVSPPSAPSKPTTTSLTPTTPAPAGPSLQPIAALPPPTPCSPRRSATSSRSRLTSADIWSKFPQRELFPSMEKSKPWQMALKKLSNKMMSKSSRLPSGALQSMCTHSSVFGWLLITFSSKWCQRHLPADNIAVFAVPLTGMFSMNGWAKMALLWWNQLTLWSMNGNGSARFEYLKKTLKVCKHSFHTLSFLKFSNKRL